jgi:hypothetical protein
MTLGIHGIQHKDTRFLESLCWVWGLTKCNDECRYAECRDYYLNVMLCRYAKCRYPECRGAICGFKFCGFHYLWRQSLWLLSSVTSQLVFLTICTPLYHVWRHSFWLLSLSTNTGFFLTIYDVIVCVFYHLCENTDCGFCPLKRHSVIIFLTINDVTVSASHCVTSQFLDMWYQGLWHWSSDTKTVFFLFLYLMWHHSSHILTNVMSQFVTSPLIDITFWFFYPLWRHTLSIFSYMTSHCPSYHM